MAKEKTKKDKKADAADCKIAEIQAKLAEVTKEKDDLFEQLQRVSADYANFQKRVPKQIADSVSYQKKDVLRSILSSLDNFEHALASAEKAETIESIVEGIKLTFDHMLDALKAHKVEKIESVGKEFDPVFHEAMMRREEADKPDNTVLEEFQSGYMMGDQVLRPAKVIVNKLAVETPPEETKEENNDQGEEKEN
jgi:molecular chaperone GrpE